MRALRERVGSITWLVLSPKPGSLGADLAAATASGPREVLVDFTHCRSVSSVDGAALCRHLWALRSKGARVVLGAVRGGARRFADTTGLTEYFPCEETLPDAVAHFRENAGHLLGQMLLAAGRLTDEQLEAALQAQAAGEPGRRLGDILVEQGAIEQGALLRALFRQKIDTLAA